MDTILPLLRTIARNSQPSPTPERRQSRPKSRGDKHAGEFDALLLLLLRKGMEYAAKRYMGSEHGTRKRNEGTPAVEVEALEKLGRAILERFMGKDAEKEGRRRGEQRHGDEQRGRKTRGQGEGHRHGESRRQHTDQGDGRRRKHRDASSESRSRHRRQYGKSRGRKHEKYHDQQEPPRRHRRRHRRSELELDDLRVRLEDMSEALIGMNERPAGRPGHEECEYYDLFVAASTPLQDAIGGVLGQMREVEGKKGRGHRSRGGAEDKGKREREVPEPEVSRGRTRRRRVYGQ